MILRYVHCMQVCSILTPELEQPIVFTHSKDVCAWLPWIHDGYFIIGRLPYLDTADIHHANCS